MPKLCPSNIEAGWPEKAVDPLHGRDGDGLEQVSIAVQRKPSGVVPRLLRDVLGMLSCGNQPMGVFPSSENTRPVFRGAAWRTRRTVGTMSTSPTLCSVFGVWATRLYKERVTRILLRRKSMSSSLMRHGYVTWQGQRHGGVPIVFVGTTNRMASVPGALKSRFAEHIRLDFYTAAELALIARQSARRMGLSLTDEAAAWVGANSGGEPRKTNRRILRNVRNLLPGPAPTADLEAVKKALELSSLHAGGLATPQVEYLHYLEQRRGDGRAGVRCSLLGHRLKGSAVLRRALPDPRGVRHGDPLGAATDPEGSRLPEGLRRRDRQMRAQREVRRGATVTITTLRSGGFLITGTRNRVREGHRTKSGGREVLDKITAS